MPPPGIVRLRSAPSGSATKIGTNRHPAWSERTVELSLEGSPSIRTPPPESGWWYPDRIVIRVDFAELSCAQEGVHLTGPDRYADAI